MPHRHGRTVQGTCPCIASTTGSNVGAPVIGAMNVPPTQGGPLHVPVLIEAEERMVTRCGQNARYTPNLPADRESDFPNCPYPELSCFSGKTFPYVIDPPTTQTSVRCIQILIGSLASRFQIDSSHWSMPPIDPLHAPRQFDGQKGSIRSRCCIIGILIAGQSPIHGLSQQSALPNAECSCLFGFPQKDLLRPAVKPKTHHPIPDTPTRPASLLIVAP